MTLQRLLLMSCSPQSSKLHRHAFLHEAVTAHNAGDSHSKAKVDFTAQALI